MNASTKAQSGISPIGDLLDDPLRVGEPDVVGSLAVFPLYGPEPRADYVSFRDGQDLGVTAHELEGQASVNDLVICNPIDRPVLLVEGEEVLGAQQNRTFDLSILVAAESELTVPVSCVERGRWQGSRNRERLRRSPQTAYPALRRAKALAARRNLELGMGARADQGEVWDEVAAKSSRMGAASDTGAMHDAYEQRRSDLNRMQQAIKLREGQAGALVAINGEFMVLDYVSRADAFASLHAPLVQGYALDALEAQDADPPSMETASGFSLLVTDCAPERRDRGVGLGHELRFDANGVTGTALVVDEELIQLTAFRGGDDESAPASRRDGRIRRPSRRRG